MQVVNKSRVDFQYKQGTSGPIISKTVLSNIVSTNIFNEMLKVEKQVNKVNAAVFEILVYNIIISNVSSINVTNVFFQDSIPEGTKFIMNSVKIDGIKKRCVNPNEGFSLGTIEANTSLLISFKVVILPKQAISVVNNHSDMCYDYIYNVEMPPIKVPIHTNEVSTLIEKNLFKQFNINTVLKISSHMPLIDNIINTDININIVNTKLVATPIISLYKLIIIGTIEYTVFYQYHKGYFNECKGIEKRKIGIQKLNDVEGFSTFMLVPCGIEYCSRDTVSIFVESVSNVLLDKKSLIVDIEMLLNL